MTPTPYGELIARLREATGPDREIDLAISCVVFDRPESYFLTDALGRREFGIQRNFTESLEQAIWLADRLLPGTGYRIQKNSNDPAVMSAEVQQFRDGSVVAWSESGNCPSLALALCIATFEARALVVEQSP